MGRRDLRPLLVVAVIAVGCAVAQTAGLHSELLHLAPLLVLALPLLAGRYVGEETLLAVVARRARPRRRPVAARLTRRRPPFALVPRGGRLLAHALAERGPPVCA